MKNKKENKDANNIDKNLNTSDVIRNYFQNIGIDAEEEIMNELQKLSSDINILDNYMIPTLEEYQKARDITIAYENEQNRLYNLQIEAFRVDLQEYFDNNPIDGIFKLKKFELRKGSFGNGEIIPIEPCMEENYEGGNNEDIKKICEKHGVDFSIVYWCYHK